jgi:hypothetical protein
MRAETSRRGGDLLAVLGAILLFVGLVGFRWYGGSATVSSVPGIDIGSGFGRSGWQAFTDSRWVWLATVLFALATVAATGGGGGRLAVAGPRALLAVLAGVSAALIAYRVVHHQPPTQGPGVAFHAVSAVRDGIWLGLVAACAIGAGACVALLGVLHPGRAGDGPPGGSP